jgi:hypothetical protein
MHYDLAIMKSFRWELVQTTDHHKKQRENLGRGASDEAH